MNEDRPGKAVARLPLR